MAWLYSVVERSLQVVQSTEALPLVRCSQYFYSNRLDLQTDPVEYASVAQYTGLSYLSGSIAEAQR